MAHPLKAEAPAQLEAFCWPSQCRSSYHRGSLFSRLEFFNKSPGKERRLSKQLHRFLRMVCWHCSKEGKMRGFLVALCLQSRPSTPGMTVRNICLLRLAREKRADRSRAKSCRLDCESAHLCKSKRCILKEGRAVKSAKTCFQHWRDRRKLTRPTTAKKSFTAAERANLIFPLIALSAGLQAGLKSTALRQHAW